MRKISNIDAVKCEVDFDALQTVVFIASQNAIQSIQDHIRYLHDLRPAHDTGVTFLRGEYIQEAARQLTNALEIRDALRALQEDSDRELILRNRPKTKQEGAE